MRKREETEKSGNTGKGYIDVPLGWTEKMVENEVSQSKSWWGSSQAAEQELKVVAVPELEDANVHGVPPGEGVSIGGNSQQGTVC